MSDTRGRHAAPTAPEMLPWAAGLIAFQILTVSMAIAAPWWLVPVPALGVLVCAMALVLVFAGRRRSVVTHD